MKTLRQQILRFAVTTLTVFTLSSCMMGPYDEQKVTNKNTKLEFWGFDLAPNTQIMISAFDPQGKKWEAIGNTASSPWSLQSKFGTDHYYWKKSLAIPGKYWEPGTIGFKAQVRAERPTSYMMSVKQNSGTCYWNSPNLSQFFTKCQAPENPVARVYTNDYRDYPAECVNKINKLRATKGFSSLKRWTEKESCADSQAKKDSQMNKSHYAYDNNNPSCTSGKSAQNECPGVSSIDSVVGSCLDDMWAEGPGQDYKKHGHYINMTDPGFTKVACGIYKTPQGSYWAVMNFQ